MHQIKSVTTVNRLVYPSIPTPSNSTQTGWRVTEVNRPRCGIWPGDDPTAFCRRHTDVSDLRSLNIEGHGSSLVIVGLCGYFCSALSKLNIRTDADDICMYVCGEFLRIVLAASGWLIGPVPIMQKLAALMFVARGQAEGCIARRAGNPYSRVSGSLQPRSIPVAAAEGWMAEYTYVGRGLSHFHAPCCLESRVTTINRSSHYSCTRGAIRDEHWKLL